MPVHLQPAVRRSCRRGSSSVAQSGPPKWLICSTERSNQAGAKSCLLCSIDTRVQGSFSSSVPSVYLLFVDMAIYIYIYIQLRLLYCSRGRPWQEEYNRAARNVFETATCSSCNFCNRTFPEEKFAEHVRVCEQFVQKDEAEELVSPSDSPRLDRSHRYFNIACHLCGKKFGKASIDIHVQQCTAVQDWPQH